MSHEYPEMNDIILVHSTEQYLIRFHAYVGNQVDGQYHAIQSLDSHYSTVHVTSCDKSLVHSNTVVLVDSIQCFLFLGLQMPRFS